jgi:NitT/TauT family transport system substrate-binding protein
MRVQLAAVAVACAALGLAACGGDDDDGGGSPAEGPTTLKVQETAGVPSAFVDFAIHKGFFDRQRLKIRLEASQGGAATVPSLMSGDIQVGGSNVVSLLLAAGRNLPIKAIAPGTSAQQSGKDFGALIVNRDSKLRRAQDLAGKRIAVNTLNNIAEVVVKASLEKEGVDVSGLKLVELPFPEMQAALDKRQVDAAFTIEPFLTTSVQKGVRVINYCYVATRPRLQVGAYAVTRQYAQENPDVVKRYQRAVADNAAYIGSHQAEFRDFLSKRAGIKPELAKTMTLPLFTGRLDTASLDETGQLMQRFGVAKEAVPASKLVQ